jgi:hypothetical protein
MWLRKYLVTFVFMATACGGDSKPSVTCGMGTTLVDGTCIGSGVSCGSGTTQVNGVCVGGDSTTCGPGTVLQGDECIADASAPGPVTGLAATASATGVGLSWTAGTSSSETLVARLVAGAYDTPDPSATYTPGQTLPGGATVVAVGAATSATDAATTPGRYSYLVWSRNAAGRYGFPRAVSTTVSPAQQEGFVSVDVGGGTATVQSPDNIALGVTNVVFDEAGGTVTFDLSVTQNTAGHLFNLKTIFEAVSVGTLANPTGTVEGEAFVTFALGAVPPGIELTRSVAISGVTATDVVAMQLRMVESPLGIAGTNAIDVDGGPALPMQLPLLRGHNNNDSTFVTGSFDASGRYFYGVTRWSPAVYRLDTATGDVTGILPAPIPSGSGSCLFIGSDGFAYFVGGMYVHRYSSASGFVIAKIDPVTMTTLAAKTLTPPLADVVHGCALHGSRLAIGFGSSVYLADTDAMTFIDADATTPDSIDPVAVTATSPVQQLVFSPDGATLYASERKTSVIYAVDPAAFTTTTYHTATGTVYGLTIDAAGVLWWGQQSGLFSFDGTTETQVPNFTDEVDAIGPRYGNKIAVAQREGGLSMVVDVTDGTVTRQGDVNNNRLGHSYIAFPTL